MIIKGGCAGNVGWWGKHLQRDDTNDRAEVREIYGLLSTNLPSALREMQAVASGGRGGANFMYQANINPRDNERLTEAQWKEAIDTLEKKLGLEGHQRVVVEHEKEGRVHRHIIWNRVDGLTLNTAPVRFNYYRHEETARELEEKFNLALTQSLHGERRPEGRPERAPELWERRAAERSGIDAKAIKAEITDLWRTTDTGKALAAAIEERGYILAQGDQRNFCIVDHSGDAHSLARRIDGAKAKDINERLADIDRDQLPTVEEAREAQREKYPSRDEARAGWESRGEADRHRPGQGQQEPRRPADAERVLKPETRHPAYAHYPAPLGKERPTTRMEERLLRIQETAERGGASVAAGVYAEGITLAKVDAAGNDRVRSDDQRRATLTDGDLVAVTKWGDVHRLDPRKIDTEKLERAATGGGDKTPSLSNALDYFATTSPQNRENRAEARAAEEARAAQRNPDKAKNDFLGAARETVRTVRDVGFKVMTADGAVTSLSSFVEGLLGMSGGRGSVPDNNPDGRTREQVKATASLERMVEAAQRGECFTEADIRNLPQAHLEQIRRFGDAVIIDIFEQLERERDTSRRMER